MGSAAESRFIPHSHFEQLREARAVLRDEAAAVEAVGERLDSRFCAAVEMIYGCGGHVAVTGMGKAGLIGQKIAATFSSTGTRAFFLHPAEAVHGDLGCLHGGATSDLSAGPQKPGFSEKPGFSRSDQCRPAPARDVLLALSNSGETEEICRLIPFVHESAIPLVAVTASETSTLGSQADVVIELGRLREAGPHGLAPTSTTTAMLALGDALALVVSGRKGFTPQQFALLHPGGSLGARLKRVDEMMRKTEDLRIDSERATIREVFRKLGRPGRRTGAVMLVDAEGRLSGLFTDSDLARLLEQRKESQLDRPIAEVMTPRPITVRPEALLPEAIEVLSERKVSELPVVDDDGRPLGLIDITDVIGFMPAEHQSTND